MAGARPEKAVARMVTGCVALAWAVAAGSAPVTAQSTPDTEHTGAPEVVLAGPDAASVRDRERGFAATMADRDYDAFLTFISPDAVFFAGDRALRGIAEIGAAWRPFFEGDVAPFSWTPDQVQVQASGGLALSTGPVTAADGSAAGRFNSVWRMDPDGVWRVVFDKGSD